MLQKINPDTACMYEIHRKEGEKKQRRILLRLETKQGPSCITSASAALRVVVCFCRENLDCSGRFENAASCIIARHASSRQLCLLACAVALWSASNSFTALGRARCSTTTCPYILETANKNKSFGEEGSSAKNKE